MATGGVIIRKALFTAELICDAFAMALAGSGTSTTFFLVHGVKTDGFIDEILDG